MSKGKQIISSLHLQHFSKYRCSSRQRSLFYYSNIVCYPCFPIHPSDFFLKHPRAPITTGRTFTGLSFHNLPVSLFRSWYFSIFSLSFSPIFTSAGAAVSRIIHTLFPCVLTRSSCKGLNGLSLLHCRVSSYILSEPISHIHLLNVAHFHLCST